MTKPTQREKFLISLLENPKGISLANPAIKLVSGDVFYSHCLNTYVSNAEMEGLDIARRKNSIQGVNRKYPNYWLQDQKQAKRAVQLINHRRMKRGLENLTSCITEKLISQFPVSIREVA